MEAVATAVLDEKERERQEQIKKLQNETCFIGHPFGVGVMNFKFMMGQITGYGMTAIFIYYLYAAAPEGVGLTKVQASQIITLDAALASIFSIVGSFMADRVFGNRRAYRFCTITGPFFYFSLAIPRLGIIGVVLYCCIGYLNSMVAGSSMYSLLGKLYAQGDKRRDGCVLDSVCALEQSALCSRWSSVPLLWWSLSKDLLHPRHCRCTRKCGLSGA